MGDLRARMEALTDEAARCPQIMGPGAVIVLKFVALCEELLAALEAKGERDA